MARPRTSLPRALTFLNRVVGAHIARQQPVLPGARALARLASVAEETVLRALGELARQGIVDRSARRRYRVAQAYMTAAAAPSVLPSPPAPPTVPTWQRVLERLRVDMLAGDVAHDGRLQSRKEMLSRYGVCPQTLRKALGSLVAGGELVRERTRLVVPGTGTPARAKVVLVARGYESGAYDDAPVHTSPIQERLRVLERECAHAGLHLEICPAVYHATRSRWSLDGRTVDAWSKGMASDRSVLGYLLWTHALGLVTREFVLPALSSHGRPVSALLSPEEAPLLPGPGARRLVRQLTACPSEHCGREAGRYLWAQGHRRCAFVSLEHDTAWSTGRLAGLRQVMGDKGQVTEYTLTIGKTRQMGDFGIDGVSAMLRGLTATLLPQHAGYTAMLTQALSGDPLAVYNVMRAEEDRRALAPLVTRLAAKEDATAVMAANDRAALACMSLLRERRVRVPQDLSVVSFDNSAQASVERLTSYDFNMPAIMRAMLAHVLGRGRRAAIPATPVAIHGSIVERHTVAAAPPA